MSSWVLTEASFDQTSPVGGEVPDADVGRPQDAGAGDSRVRGSFAVECSEGVGGGCKVSDDELVYKAYRFEGKVGMAIGCL